MQIQTIRRTLSTPGKDLEELSSPHFPQERDRIIWEAWGTAFLVLTHLTQAFGPSTKETECSSLACTLKLKLGDLVTTLSLKKKKKPLYIIFCHFLCSLLFIMFLSPRQLPASVHNFAKGITRSSANAQCVHTCVYVHLSPNQGQKKGRTKGMH